MEGVRTPASVYHLSDVANLQSIIEYDRVMCTNELLASNIDFNDISWSDIQKKRARTVVPCGPGGVLHDYVPAFFGIRSPMLYIISKGRVDGVIQEPLIHLLTTVQQVKSSGEQFVFTDGHGIMGFTKFYTDTSDLNQLDWEVLRARIWRDTNQDGDRQRRREAEFLVHGGLPWELVQRVGVRSQAIRDQVETIFDQVDAKHRPDVQVRPAWYYYGS